MLRIFFGAKAPHVDMIFDWLRITPDERFMGGLDEIDGDFITKP